MCHSIVIYQCTFNITFYQYNFLECRLFARPRKGNKYYAVSRHKDSFITIPITPAGIDKPV